MKRSGFLRRKTGLKPVSAKREAQLDAYQQAKAAVILRDGWCQGPKHGIETPCVGVLDPHHILPQSHFPQARCCPDAMVLLCRGHHDYVHGHPAWSRAMGLLV